LGQTTAAVSAGLTPDFTVGEWAVSRATNRIARRGETIQLEPLAMDVLVHLCSRPGEVVSIDELIARVWNGRATESSVYRTINQVRHALEGDGDEGRYLQTIRKRGYRLIASVEMSATADDAGLPLDLPRSSIAVLPFENLSPDPENAFFADGMHGEVLSQLAKISSLRVISRTSVLGYRQSVKNVRQIAQELGAGTILEGTVQRSGGSARINVQLIDAARDEHVWAQIYERKLTPENVFAIQSDIATAVAAALHAALLPHEADRLSSVPTQNPIAYDLYLSGTAQLYQANYSDVSGWFYAIKAFQGAVGQDPDFALAWANLARMHALVYHLCIDRTPARVALAEQALARAQALEPDLPEVHLAAGEYYYRIPLDHARALAAFELAARGMSDSSELLFARALVYKRLGNWEQSMEAFEQARLLDPRSPRLIFNQADTYISVPEYEIANQYLQDISAIDPGYVHAHVWRAIIPLMRDGDVRGLESMPPADYDWIFHLKWMRALYLRDYDAACAVFDGWKTGVFGWPWCYKTKALAYGVTYDLAGRTDEAREAMREGRAQIEAELARNADDPRLYIALGEAQAILGRPEEAIMSARRALAMRPASTDAYLHLIYKLDAIIRVLIPAGAIEEAIVMLDEYLGTRGAGWTIEGVLPDPRLDPIREHPDFAELVARHRRT